MIVQLSELVPEWLTIKDFKSKHVHLSKEIGIIKAKEIVEKKLKDQFSS